MSRLQAISRLNQEFPNKDATPLLPPDRRAPDQLHLLVLAQLGLEQGINVEGPGEGATQEQVEQQVYHLELNDPEQVMALLDPVLNASALEGLTQEQASTLVLETIRDLLDEKAET